MYIPSLPFDKLELFVVKQVSQIAVFDGPSVGTRDEPCRRRWEAFCVVGGGSPLCGCDMLQGVWVWRSILHLALMLLPSTMAPVCPTFFAIV